MTDPSFSAETTVGELTQLLSRLPPETRFYVLAQSETCIRTEKVELIELGGEHGVGLYIHCSTPTYDRLYPVFSDRSQSRSLLRRSIIFGKRYVEKATRLLEEIEKDEREEPPS